MTGQEVYCGRTRTGGGSEARSAVVEIEGSIYVFLKDNFEGMNRLNVLYLMSFIAAYLGHISAFIFLTLFHLAVV